VSDKLKIILFVALAFASIALCFVQDGSRAGASFLALWFLGLSTGAACEREFGT